MSRVAHGDGVAISFDVEGRGAPCLLIAGTMSDRTTWTPIRAGLSRHYTTVAFDNRDIGSSSLSPTGYTPADLARDALAVLDAAEVPSAHVIGHSLGGQVAQELALLAPDRVDKLVLANTWARTDQFLDQLFALWMRLRTVLVDDEDFLAAMSLGVLDGNPEAVTTLGDIVSVASERPQAPAAFLRNAEADRAADTAGRLADIRSLTLVIESERDRIFAPRYARELIEGIPNCAHRQIANAGHMAMADQPELFLASILEFLGTGAPNPSRSGRVEASGDDEKTRSRRHP